MFSILNETISDEFRDTDKSPAELIKEISMEGDSVSLEGLVGDLALGVSNSLTSSMTSMRKGLSNFLPFTYSTSSELKKKSEQYDFIDIAKIPLTVPESFKGYMNEYAVDLNDIHNRHKIAMNATMKKHKKKLIALLASGDYESNVHYSKEFKNNALTLKKDKALFNKYYPKNTGTQKALVSDIFGNWDEIIDLHEFINNKSKVRITTKEELEQILLNVKETNEILIRVRDDIRSDNSKKRTRTLKDIAGGIYTLAQEVDFYSTMVFELHVLMELTSSNEEILLDFKGDK